jgi:hypothetical protein
VIVCSICVYVGRPGDAVPDGADPEDMVVVMNGQSVCIDHAGLVGNGGDRHRMITMAVRERGYDTLGELQLAASAARREAGS